MALFLSLLIGLLALGTVQATTIAELSFKLNMPTNVDNVQKTTEPVVVNNPEKAQNEAAVNSEPTTPVEVEAEASAGEKQTSPSDLISLDAMKLSKGQPIISPVKLNNTYSSGSLSSLLLAALAPLRVEGKDGQLLPVQQPNLPVPFASVVNQRENVQPKIENKNIQSIKDLHTTIISSSDDNQSQQGSTAIEAEIDAIVAKTTGQLIGGSSAVSNQQHPTSVDDSIVEVVSTKIQNLNGLPAQAAENDNNTVAPPTVPIAVPTEPSLLNISTVLNVPLRELGLGLGSSGGNAGTSISAHVWLTFGTILFVLFKRFF